MPRLILLCLIQRQLLQLRHLLVQLIIRLIIIRLLQVLKVALPDGTERSSRIRRHTRPRRLRTQQLHAIRLGRERAIKRRSGTSNAAKALNLVECVVTQDVLRDERLGVEYHDRLRLLRAAIRDLDALRKDLLLELIPKRIRNRDLNLLHDNHDGRDLLELVLEVALAEQVVEVLVEAVVHLVDDEHFVDLLHDLLLEAVVDDL